MEIAMLVLTRKPNQQLHIGNDIVITVVKVRGNTIRLGIEAPKDVRVIRSELEPKELGGQELESQELEPQALDSQELEIRSSGAAASAPAAETGDQAAGEAAHDPASPGDGQVGAHQVAEVTTARLLLKTRDRSGCSSGLKGFRSGLRSRTGFAERNLEDCPLCHRAPRAGQMQSQAAAGHGSSPLSEVTARAAIG
jgi:carbon storage regulator CsrA